MPLSRREFLSGATGVVSVSGALPCFCSMSRCVDRTSTEFGGLVVIQLPSGMTG